MKKFKIFLVGLSLSLISSFAFGAENKKYTVDDKFLKLMAKSLNTQKKINDRKENVKKTYDKFVKLTAKDLNTQKRINDKIEKLLKKKCDKLILKKKCDELRKKVNFKILRPQFVRDGMMYFSNSQYTTEGNDYLQMYDEEKLNKRTGSGQIYFDEYMETIKNKFNAALDEIVEKGQVFDRVSIKGSPELIHYDEDEISVLEKGEEYIIEEDGKIDVYFNFTPNKEKTEYLQEVLLKNKNSKSAQQYRDRFDKITRSQEIIKEKEKPFKDDPKKIWEFYKKTGEMLENNTKMRRFLQEEYMNFYKKLNTEKMKKEYAKAGILNKNKGKMQKFVKSQSQGNKIMEKEFKDHVKFIKETQIPKICKDLIRNLKHVQKIEVKGSDELISYLNNDLVVLKNPETLVIDLKGNVDIEFDFTPDKDKMEKLKKGIENKKWGESASNYINYLRKKMAKQQAKIEEQEKQDLKNENTTFLFFTKDEVKEDEIKKDEVKEDEVKEDEAKEYEVKKDEINKDEVNKDEVNKDEVNKDEVNKDEVNKR